MGVHFVQVPMDFLRDILQLDPGSQELPFFIDLASLGEGKYEFINNLKFGGVIIKDDPGSQAPLRPAIHSTVQVKIQMEAHRGEIQFPGVVVAHLPFGFGLRIDNAEEILNKML